MSRSHSAKIIERLPAAAAELVALDIDVLSQSAPSRRAQLSTERHRPCRVSRAQRSYEEHLVSSLVRPGENITGITLAQSDRRVDLVFVEAAVRVHSRHDKRNPD